MNVDRYVTCEMVNHVGTYLDICRSLKKKATQTWIEEKVYIRDDMFGTVDFAALLDQGELLHIVDLKYGKGVPVYPDTPQAKYYAIGILNVLSEEVLQDLVTIRVTICQPRINNTQTEDFTVKELFKFNKVLLKGADRCDESEKALKEGRFEDVELSPGSHCGFCRARHRCRALYNFVVDKGPMKDSWLGFAKAHHSAQKRNEFITEQVGLLSKEELEEYFAWSDLATRTGNAIKEKLTSLGAAGEEFSTLKLVSGRSSRDWKDRQEAKAFLKKSNVHPFEEKLLSPAQAEKKIIIPDELVQKKVGKPALVPLSDRRKPLVNEDQEIVESLFEPIESDD